MWIKICGITRLQDAVSAARFGADAVGFVFADGPRRVTTEQAVEISRAMPPGPARVGVFRDAPPSEVGRITEYVGLDMVQLHGSEDVDYRRPPGDRVIRALRIRELADLVRARRYPCRAVLLDGYGYSDDDGIAGASGARGGLDWRMVRAVKPGRPVIIAGGLDPGNVGRAIRETTPYGVDVSAGVESAPGIKDPVLVYEFIEKARKADYELNGN